MDKVYLYFLLFLIYSFIGWIMEIYVTFYKSKKIVNRGFLIGPYCPIYGYASIIMILYLNHYKDNPLTVFLLAVVICTFIEYIISYIMEKLFNARWWDYSNYKFNINGRVCLTNAFFFGVLGTFLVYYANPFFENILLKINTNTLNTISLILMILFTIDFIISMYATFKLKSSINKINKDNTEEFKKKFKEKIENKILSRRILKAYPKYKNNIIKKIEEYRQKIEKK
ncbi:MAG: putative ABC transporter permease [Bacilli bacterium]